MATDSISQLEKPINENKRTAIIYSISDLAEYLVEIRHHNENYFVSANGEPKRFGNLSEARRTALAHEAEEGFLALNKTYQEVDGSKINDNSRYDYMHLDLNEA